METETIRLSCQEFASKTGTEYIHAYGLIKFMETLGKVKLVERRKGESKSGVTKIYEFPKTLTVNI